MRGISRSDRGRSPKRLARIDGIARGIGDGQAIVTLEPDGFGIISHNNDRQGTSEWSQSSLPDGLTPESLSGARYEPLNAAVDRLAPQTIARVHVDATHRACLSSGDAEYRLVKAGVARADGVILNVSNYHPTRGAHEVR